MLTQAVIEEPCVGKRSTMSVVTVFKEDVMERPTAQCVSFYTCARCRWLTDELQDERGRYMSSSLEGPAVAKGSGDENRSVDGSRA